MTPFHPDHPSTAAPSGPPPTTVSRAVADVIDAARALGASTVIVRLGDGPGNELSIDVKEGDVVSLLFHDRNAVICEPEPCPLTPRQVEVLEHLALGQPPKAVARLLGIAESTCRDHIKAARARLGCTSAWQAVVDAQHKGWLATTVDGDGVHAS